MTHAPGSPTEQTALDPTAPEVLTDDFASRRCWAVVGVSTDREKYGNKIYRRLKESGYRVYAVNPKLPEVEGDPCYPNLAQLPEVPEVVNVVVPPAAGLAVIEDCLAKGVRRVWFQPGAESPEAIEKAQQAGMQVLWDACILIQHRQWSNDA
ncbi:MAG: CoA-binding protein [Candidatus Melainabacteria bacterium]|nr:CoA-binding protein [Candidatus Melainabacteria bacterium]